MLTATGLNKSYNNLTVLKNVSLEIPKGTFVSIVGPSGAGKSTLLHLLSSLDKPDQGSVSLIDTEIFKLSPKLQAKFRNQHMGFVFQAHHLLPEFTAIENVNMPLLISGMSTKEATQKSTQILERVGLGHRLHHKPTELSGGEQQRVAIARAIVHHPKIVFADEPTGNLDSQSAQAIHQLFLELQNDYQLTLVVVTHNEILADLADIKVTMVDGNIHKMEHIESKI